MDLKLILLIVFGLDVTNVFIEISRTYYINLFKKMKMALFIFLVFILLPFEVIPFIFFSELFISELFIWYTPLQFVRFCGI